MTGHASSAVGDEQGELTQALGQGRLGRGRRGIAPRDRLEVLGRPPGNLQHMVAGRAPARRSAPSRRPTAASAGGAADLAVVQLGFHQGMRHDMRHVRPESRRSAIQWPRVVSKGCDGEAGHWLSAATCSSRAWRAAVAEHKHERLLDGPGDDAGGRLHHDVRESKLRIASGAALEQVLGHPVRRVRGDAVAGRHEVHRHHHAGARRSCGPDCNGQRHIRTLVLDRGDAYRRDDARHHARRPHGHAGVARLEEPCALVLAPRGHDDEPARQLSSGRPATPACTKSCRRWPWIQPRSANGEGSNTVSGPPVRDSASISAPFGPAAQ